MATINSAYSGASLSGLKEFTITFYTAQATADDGEWLSTAGWQSLFLIVDLGASDVITVGGSNASTIPANSSDGIAIASTITADGVLALERHQLPKYIKVHASTVTNAIASCIGKVVMESGQQSIS